MKIYIVKSVWFDEMAGESRTFNERAFDSEAAAGDFSINGKSRFEVSPGFKFCHFVVEAIDFVQSFKITRTTEDVQEFPFPDAFNIDWNKQSDCMWENLSPEDRMKPMGLVCRCKKCSPWC